MSNIQSEKDYQRYIMERLEKDNGYIIRKAVNYDRYFALDREMLFKFLNDTQPDTMAALKKVYKDAMEETLINFINSEMTKARGSLLNVLKHGVEISGYQVDLMYRKPATTLTRTCWTSTERTSFPLWKKSGQAMKNALTLLSSSTVWLLCPLN